MGKENLGGLAVSAFLASGGLGFLFGIIYYTIVWQEEESRWILNWPWRKIGMPWLWKKGAWLGKKLGIKLGANFCPVLQRAECNGWLKLSCCKSKIETSQLSKRGAWRVITSYANMRVGTSTRIKEAMVGVNRMSNFMNALGTTYLGSLLAFFSFVIYNVGHVWPGESSLWGWLSVILGLCILCFHHFNYQGIIKDYENGFGAILLNEFENEYNENNYTVIKIQAFKNDLKRNC